MASLKKYWFAMNREHKQASVKCSDSIESTKASSMQPTDAHSSPEKPSACEKVLKPQCSCTSSSTEATLKTEAPPKQIIQADSNKITASSPTLASESVQRTVSSVVLQKATHKSEKDAAADGTGKGSAKSKKKSTGKKGTATGKKEEPVVGEESSPKSGSGKGKRKSVKKKSKPSPTEAEEPVVGEEMSPKSAKGKAAKKSKKSVGAKEEPVVGEEAATPVKGKKSVKRKAKPAVKGEEPVVGEETSPTAKVKGARKKTKPPKGTEEPVVGEEGTPAAKVKKKRKAPGTEEPVVGEEERTAEKRKKRKDKAAPEEAPPAKVEEVSPAPSPKVRVKRKRKLEEAPKKPVFAKTPSTTASSLWTPRTTKKRKAFSAALTFPSRVSTLDSLDEFERRRSAAHEQQLQRAWRSADARLLKMLPTPLKTPLYLSDPPSLGFEGTLTTELRREFVKRKLDYMKKPSLELVKDPLMLRFIQPKMNKCDVLRKKHIKRQTIMSTYFEQHYDRFQKPPFKTIRLARKCI